jgi:acetyl esterase/lipase
MKIKHLFFSLIFSILYMSKSSAQYLPLYKNIPNYIDAINEEVITNDGILRIGKVSIPGYQYFRAANDTIKRPCVIICPGGGYGILAATHEGTDVAAYFNTIGINAMVLKYRIPNSAHQVNKSIAPLQDAQQAMYLARTNANKWGIDADKIGIMGFSAGGHLASTAATHYEDVKVTNPLNISYRPNFQILIYPVITFSSNGHQGSRNNLIGPVVNEDQVHYFSNEAHINKHAPPAFLVHAKDDESVPVSNSINYYQQLQENQVASELYLFEKGGHGFGMKNKTSEIFWPKLMHEWLLKNNIINK